VPELRIWGKRGAGTVDADRIEDYNLGADVGNPYEEDGLTRVTLSGSGILIVEQHIARPPGEGEKPPQEDSPAEVLKEPAVAVQTAGREEFGRGAARELIVRAGEFPWGQRFPTRPGIPSEPVLEWRLNDAHGQGLTLKMWLRDAEREDLTSPVIMAFRHAVERVTKGELFL
jgi:hypothetical protein